MVMLFLPFLSFSVSFLIVFCFNNKLNAKAIEMHRQQNIMCIQTALTAKAIRREHKQKRELTKCSLFTVHSYTHSQSECDCAFNRRARFLNMIYAVEWSMIHSMHRNRIEYSSSPLDSLSTIQISHLIICRNGILFRYNK